MATREKMLARRRERYTYAKSKGFNSYECSALAGHSEKQINNLAKEMRENGNEKTNN